MQTQQGYQLSLILFSIVLKILDISIREKKEIKEFQIGNEEIKLSLSADDMIVCIENPKDVSRKLLELINEFGKVTGWKITTPKPLTFYTLTKKKSEREIKKTISFTITSKRTKYIGINLTKEAKDLLLKKL